MTYDGNLCSIMISADELCELAHKSGDLDYRYTSLDKRTSSLISSEIYQKIYRTDAALCTHDVLMSLTHKHGDLYFTVEVSADTVVKKDGRVRIDQLRPIRKYEFFAPPKQEWLSLLKCSALFYAKREGLSAIAMRMYYIMRDGDDGIKIKNFDYYYKTEELEVHFISLLEKIAPRARLVYERETVVLPSAGSSVFPYESLREGQEIMIRQCYSSINHGRRLFLQAPTGTGKTVAALYPSIRAIGNGLADKVFYLTSKSSTRREAYRGASKLFKAGALVRTVVIGAKEQVCICPSKNFGSGALPCNSKECPYAAGYYDRAESAIMELAHTGHGYTVSRISEVAKKYSVCPYELSLDLSELCDIIICDYNYAFDPSVYFRRYFSSDNAEEKKYVFLVDEAHNLADRARDMYSAALRSNVFEKIYEYIDEEDTALRKIFEKIIYVIKSQRILCKDTLTRDANGHDRGFYISNTLLSLFCKELDIFKKQCEEWLKSNREHILWGAVNDVLGRVKKYLCVSEYFDSRFYNYVYVDGDTVGIRIFCLDPSYILDKLQNRALSTIMFSATLTPIDYFSEILGGGRKTSKIILPSPFDPSNLCVAVAGYLSTRFEERNDSLARYVSVIAATVSRKAGNYIAYFPSYECLEAVYSLFIKKYPKVYTVVQKRGMTLEQKEEFLDFFADDKGVLRVGFCVLGGSFSEGVDLPGGRLIGTIIFGVGLPGISNERNIMREYYDNRSECGYDYAYTFPGMNNVLQAAGRVIRRADDKGVVVLADDRYCEEKYKMLFPEHWKHIKKADNASELAEIIQIFWSKS